MPHIIHDGKVDIATGKSRKELNWKNKEVLWSDLVEKLSATHRTAETYNEYITSKKQRQDEIKDIGGFVGGYLSNGKRKKDTVAHRQLITLDIDFGTANVWELFTMMYDCAAAVYSTHKHTPQQPRLRLILPLDRPVGADEWIAISRRIAGNIGINSFDDTTFEPSRLMYWPSTAKDGEYLFEYQDGQWLCADEVLATYRNWRDSSEWPVSDRYNAVIQQAIKKQGDPLEKPGIVGAFCRTYSIDAAIETFLGDVYEACDIPGRYTYKEGSTSAGVVTYEDRYAYSHHGTDPASGKLCNAFDLVRLHLYGLKDEDAKEGTPGHKLPSFIEMEKLCNATADVKQTVSRERLQEAAQDFSNITDADIEAQIEWFSQLDTDNKNNIRATRNNFKLILENDPNLKGKFAFDLFSKRIVVTGNLPWRKVTDDTRLWGDVDDADLRIYLADEPYGLSAKEALDDAFMSVAAKKAVHPVKDYLDRLQWDGTERIERLFIDYLGAEDTIYTRTVTRKALVAAVARIFEPGVKFDYVLTLVGEEGRQKSTIFNKLGHAWFSDSFSFHALKRGKEAFEQLQGYWIIEIGELTGLGKAEVESVKHFISKRFDVYRLPHATYTSKFDRQCVFFGSTNQWDFLRGANGNRRFWPVIIDKQEAVKIPAVHFTPDEVDQVWAEAVTLYHKGETLFLPEAIESMARDVQKTHTEADERVGVIERYLNTLLPETWLEKDIAGRRAWLKSGDDLVETGTVQRTQVCAAEIWCELFEGFQKDMTSINTKYIHEALRRIEGWEPTKTLRRFGLYGAQKAYVRTKKTTPTPVNGKAENVNGVNGVENLL